MNADARTIIVTGSNKGIGFEVVRQLAKQNHNVILTARENIKGKEAVDRLKAEGLNVHFLLLDVSDDASIKHAAQQVKVRFGKVDVLINNAAVLLREDQSVAEGTTEVFHKTMRTNVFGSVQMVRHFLSLIPDGGRIINTSSGGGSMSDPVGGWSPVYCVSKSALNAATRHLAYELAGQNISVNAYCPGWVSTDMGGKSAPRTIEQGADTAVWLATAAISETGKFFRDRKIIPW
ncbi:MAG: SDR family oxidoreductase [Cyclobacteriaceae bacterium]|nr:SDR family oxidoreductase [Cyclobacteriaceae bacterium]